MHSRRRLFCTLITLTTAACFHPGAEDTAPGGTSTNAYTSALSCSRVDVVGYVDGVPFPMEVVHVDGVPVTKNTAHAFLRMQAAAEASGASLQIVSGFRSMQEQEYLYDCYATGNCNDGNRAAAPGYSNHQSGVALDLTTSEWLADNAFRYGFTNTVSDEPWHYELTDPREEAGPCDTAQPVTQGKSSEALNWSELHEGGWYRGEAFWMKVHSSSDRVARVEYFVDAYPVALALDRQRDFPAMANLNTGGRRRLTARGYADTGEQVAETALTVEVVVD